MVDDTGYKIAKAIRKKNESAKKIWKFGLMASGEILYDYSDAFKE